MYDEMIFNRVKKAFDSENMVFFVGAGISVNSGVPGFGKLNRIVISTIVNGKLNEDELELLSRNIRPEVVLQRGRDELGGEGDRVVESLGMISGPEPDYYRPCYNHIFLAEALRHGNWIFTTNFDNLIEEACKNRKIEFKRCYREQDFGEFIRKYKLDEKPDPRDIEGGYLFKLHGTIEEEKRGLEKFNSIQVALNQVGQGIDKNKEKVLRYFLEYYDFCFIGYSDQDDFSIRPVLEDIGCGKRVFWFDHAKGEVGEITWGKERLQVQKEEEEAKSPQEKKWEIINVNKFLLKSKEAIKLIGNSSNYIKNKLCPIPGVDTKTPTERQEQVSGHETFEQWAKDIDELNRNVFIGRLFEDVREWDKAEQYYNQAIKLSEDKKQLIRAKERLARVYYMRDERGKEDDAIKIYWECVNTCKELKDSFKAACLKIDIANVERRIGGDERYRRSKELAEEAERELRQFKNGNREQKLGYARCLNVLGLVYLAGPERDNAKGLELCEKSKGIKIDEGDMDGVAESENAIGLHLTGQGRDLSKQGQELAAKERFEDAIRHLNEAINIRERYGFFRGCAQPCRNIGDAYRGLMVIYKKKEYFQRAGENYKRGIDFWKLIRPRWPVGEVLHFNQRLARLYVDFVVDFTELISKGEQEGLISKVISMYEDEILSNQDMLREIKVNSRELDRGKKILSDTRELCKKMNLLSKVEEINKILEKLMPRKFSFNWAGALKDYRNKYTSVELQKKALEWRE